MSPAELVLAGGMWRVTFTRHGDRLSHRIEARADGALIPLLESLEGNSEQLWPASPPVQQAHLETRGATHILLGVGMAGASHWSLSVELDPLSDQLVFDVACRAKSPPDFLGSTYRACGDDAARALLNRFSLQADAASTHAPLSLEQALDRQTLHATAAGGSRPLTVRWCYRLTAQPSSGR